MAAGAGLNLPQARLPQPAVFGGTTPPFQEWMQETRNFLNINNYEFIRQMDDSLQSDREISLQDVTDSATRGREGRDDLTANERAQNVLREELDSPSAGRRPGRTNATIRAEFDALQDAYPGLETAYNDVLERVSRGGEYLNYVLIHGTKLGTEANNYVRRLQRSTNGFEILRLLRLRYSGRQMLQNYQLLRELLSPKFTESQQHYQYRQWFELLSRFDAAQPLDDNLKIATLVNGLRGNLRQHLLFSVKPTFRDLLMGLFRGAVFRYGGGALKQPIKEPTETPTSTLALMGRFPSLMGRFPTLMGRFTDFVVRGRFTS